jgi:hypothetical protein
MLTRVHQKEPTLLYALLTAAGGFLVQNQVAGIDWGQALGSAGGIAGIQGLLTRQRVWAPANGKRHVQRRTRATDVPTPPRATFAVNQAEPAMAMAVGTGLVGFLTQVAADVPTMQALATAAGISGTQGTLIRPAVHAPGTVARKRWRATADRLRSQAAAGGVDVRPTKRSPRVLVAATGDSAERIDFLPIVPRAGEGRRVAMSLKLAGARPGTAMLAAGDLLKTSAEIEVTTDGKPDQPHYKKPYDYSPVVRGELLLARDDKAVEAKRGEAIRLAQSEPAQVSHTRHHHVIVFRERAQAISREVAGWGADACVNLVLEARNDAAQRGQCMLVGQNDEEAKEVGHDMGRISVLRLRPATYQRGRRERNDHRRVQRIPIVKDHRTIVYSLELKELKKGEQLDFEAMLLTSAAHLRYPARISTRLFIADHPDDDGPGGHAAEVCLFRGEISKSNGFNCLAGRSCTTRKVGVMRMRQDAGRPLYANLAATSAYPFGGSTGQALEVVPGGYIEAVRYPPNLTG